MLAFQHDLSIIRKEALDILAFHLDPSIIQKEALDILDPDPRSGYSESQNTSKPWFYWGFPNELSG